MPAECPYCGQSFNQLKDGNIPTHDFPPPCRSVCRGSGEHPRMTMGGKKVPLYKDDPEQQAKDFFYRARQELLLYGFAVVKQMAIYSGKPRGETMCPLCGQRVAWAIAESNGHCRVNCSSSHCVSGIE